MQRNETKKILDFFMAMAGNDTIDFVSFSIITTPTRMRTPNKQNHSRCLTSSTLEFIRLDMHFFHQIISEAQLNEVITEATLIGK